jgi:hypothetical protein
MRPLRAVVTVGVLLLVGACGVAREPAATTASRAPILAERDLFADPVWDDGQAEYSTYRGTMPHYGKPRPLSARIIIVKEDMDVAARVKVDGDPPAGGARTVLKVNYLHDFPTGTYDHHQMSSVFLDRASGSLEKLAMSSTEGCGITYVEVLPGASAWRHVSHSYWEGEGDRDLSLPTRSDRPTAAWDGLVLWLRRLDLARPQSFPVDLLPGQVSGRVRATALVPATIELPGRVDDRGWPVTVRVAAAEGTPERVDRFWFEAAWPHGLVRLERADGAVLERVKTIRLDYWEKTDPGDEALVEP